MSSVETTSTLPMRGGLTIDIYIPPGILKPPSALTKFFWFLGSNPILFLPLFTLAVMFALWYSVGRDPDPGVSVAPQYEPPKGMCPAEAGTLLDDAIHPRDITSTIVDLAVRGYIKIEEKVDTFLVFHHKDYLFHLLKPREQWGTDLTPHERVMLENIFFAGDETRLSDLKNRFYTVIPASFARTSCPRLKSKGIYTLDPESANGYSIAAAVAIALLVVAVQVMGWMNLFSSVPLLVASVLVSAANLVALCAADDRENRHRRTHHDCCSRFSGIHEPRRRRSHQAHAARHLRKIPPLRHGLGSRAPLGASLRRHSQRPAQLVRFAERIRRIQSAFLFQFDAQHGDGYAPGLYIVA